ncbi:MAG: hypothetical protein ACPG5U_08790 [Planktomarina sp.]
MLFSTAAAGADDCTLQGDYCVPVVACIEASSEIFEGRTYGRDRGTVATYSTKGATCSGTWQRTLFGMGTGAFACDDGRDGTVVFYYLDQSTGTALGRGTTSADEGIQFWAGHNLPTYFGENGVLAEVMRCGANEVLLGS